MKLTGGWRRLGRFTTGQSIQKHLLIEAVLERRRVSSKEALFVNWLALRHPLANFTAIHPRLPGQEVPGLEALIRDLQGVPLLDATTAVAQGHWRGLEGNGLNACSLRLLQARNFCAQLFRQRKPCAKRSLLRAKPGGSSLARRGWMPRKALPGIGLSPLQFCLLLAVSVGLFLIWGGPFWLAPQGTSHLGRIAISYLAVVPLAFALLLWSHRLSWSHFLTSCGATWAIKLMVTALLYEFFASQSTAPLQPRAVSDPVPVHSVAHYQPASGAFHSTPLSGNVSLAHEPVDGAVVYLEDPPPGRALAPPKSVQLVIDRLRYQEPLYVARRGDSLGVINRDASLHTIRFKVDGRAHSSQPVLSSPSPQPVRLPPPGLYELSCANHPTESTWLLVVDHPYFARTDSTGRFSFQEVPAQAVRIAALAWLHGRLFKGTGVSHRMNGHQQAEIELATLQRAGFLAQEDHGP